MNLTGMISLFAPETLLTAMLVVLLLIKIFYEKTSPKSVLVFVSLFFLAATLITLAVLPTGNLFGGMFQSSPLIAIEKSLLLLATFIISLQAFQWLRNFKNYL